MEPIYSLLPRMRNYIYGNIDGEKANTLRFHRSLLESIRGKEEELSLSLMKEHLERTRAIYDKYLSKE
jgi:GntR family transcriptional repressor for pyruvate dehydrogenase complex